MTGWAVSVTIDTGSTTPAWSGQSLSIPLALRLHTQMRPRFFKRDFHGPATDKPGQPRLRGMAQGGRQQGLWLKTLVRIANQHPAEQQGGSPEWTTRPYRSSLPPRGARRHTTAQ